MQTPRLIFPYLPPFFAIPSLRAISPIRAVFIAAAPILVFPPSPHLGTPAPPV